MTEKPSYQQSAWKLDDLLTSHEGPEFERKLADLEALVVEVEGETHELTGSAEVQYAKWRALLKRIYLSETGFSDS